MKSYASKFCSLKNTTLVFHLYSYCFFLKLLHIICILSDILPHIRAWELGIHSKRNRYFYLINSCPYFVTYDNLLEIVGREETSVHRFDVNVQELFKTILVMKSSDFCYCCLLSSVHLEKPVVSEYVSFNLVVLWSSIM